MGSAERLSTDLLNVNVRYRMGGNDCYALEDPRGDIGYLIFG